MHAYGSWNGALQGRDPLNDEILGRVVEKLRLLRGDKSPTSISPRITNHLQCHHRFGDVHYPFLYAESVDALGAPDLRAANSVQVCRVSPADLLTRDGPESLRRRGGAARYRLCCISPPPTASTVAPRTTQHRGRCAPGQNIPACYAMSCQKRFRRGSSWSRQIRSADYPRRADGKPNTVQAACDPAGPLQFAPIFRSDGWRDRRHAALSLINRESFEKGRAAGHPVSASANDETRLWPGWPGLANCQLGHRRGDHGQLSPTDTHILLLASWSQTSRKGFKIAPHCEGGQSRLRLRGSSGFACTCCRDA